MGVYQSLCLCARWAHCFTLSDIFFKGERRRSFQREKQLRFSASPEKKDGRGSSDGGMSDEEEVKQNVWGKKKSDQNAIFRGKGREKMADSSVVPKKMEISRGMGGGGGSRKGRAGGRKIRVV